MPLRQIASRLSPRGWAVVGGSALVAILFLYIVIQLASAPSYSTLLTGLDPAQTGKITSALDTKGITYEIQNNGTALAVPPSQTGQARIALATAGLLGTSQQPGFSLFDNQQLGASNFQQQITYQRALEGQLSQTIESIQGISSAQVQLVLPNPQDQLFASKTTPSTAAVLIAGSTSIDPASVRGIAELVASSVPGLSADKVTITASTGQQLWPGANGTADAVGSSVLPAKQAAEHQYDAAMAAQVTSLLTQTLGPGKAQVDVNADLNTNQATSDSLVYAKKGVPLQQQNQTETLQGGGAQVGGGTAGSIPAYAQTAGGGKSNYSNKTTNTTYGVDKTVTHAVIAPGKVNSQTVSVLLDKSVPKAEIPQLRAAVANAVGLVPSRGDKISIGQVAFAKPVVPPVPSTPGNMFDYIRIAAVGLGVLGFLIVIWRVLRRRERETLATEPTWLRELESPRPLSALERSGFDDGGEAEVMQLRAPVNAARRQVEELVERDPDRVAQQLRAWMSEE